MASLVNTISNILQAFYGVNILEQAPAGDVQGASTSIVGTVADLPWGPVDTVTPIGSAQELFDTFAPAAFGQEAQAASHPALLAFVNKTFPATLKIVRVAPTGAATAAQTYDDVGAVDSVDVTAAHPGLLGNRLTVEWTVNADNAADRDATVRITGTTYEVLYAAVATAVPLAVTDPGDPFATFSAAGAFAAVPVAAAAAPLLGGLDGTAVIADYLGTPSTNTRGLEGYTAAGEAVDVLFGAEVPQALVATWNAGLRAWAILNDRAFGVLSTDSAITTPAAAITDVASFRDDRLAYLWPRVKTINTFDPDRAETVVDGNAFAAVAIASVPPEVSPGGAPGSAFLKGITGQDHAGASAVTNKAMNAAGIVPWFNSTALEGYILHRGLTTTLTAGLTKIFRRRMTDFLMDSIAASAERFIGTLLDLDLPNKGLGANTGLQKGLWDDFLATLVTDQRVSGYSIDAFTANTQVNIDAGQWRVIIAVKLFSAQEEIVFLADIGETVEIVTQ